MSQFETWVPQRTGDGSFTFFSAEFGEAFHSRSGAKAEAMSKFATATNLAELAQSVPPQSRPDQHSRLCLLDVCYGLGYNTAAALETIWSKNPDCAVEVYALEQDLTVPLAAIAPELLQPWTPAVRSLLTAIATHHSCYTPKLTAELLLGDARRTIQILAARGIQADAIFFDPFSPRRCPELWTVEFLAQVARCLAPTGKLATYSRSAAVRAAMQAAGLQIGTIPLPEMHLPHQWSQGTIAAWHPDHLHPLSALEQEHLQTRAAIPYRDPTLSDSATTILERQQQEQQRSSRESTSSWRRRWNIT
jgi:tRNA U34 5-methylaminomethyl-2-thiouridine-forming methyltransferase MnmC